MLKVVIDLFCEMKSLSSTKKRVETEIFRFFSQFSKIWNIEERYKIERIRERVNSWPTLTSILKKREEKLF